MELSVGLSWAFFLLSLCHGWQGDNRFMVTTKLGKIQGSPMLTFNGKRFVAFQAIPYAKPPVGPLRFKDPEPIDKWEGILDATMEGPPCPQVWDGVFNGDEDCVYLNIYTEKLSTNQPKPVLIFVHGGAWYLGNSGIYGPKYFLEKNIVLVTVNYRLGPLGFLSTEDAEAPGNYGLLDQTMALKWIRDHIDRFGGDPKSMTLFGEGTGAASVHYHLLSPGSKGLFQRAIAQSGVATCPWAQFQHVKNYTTMLADYLNCTTNTSRQLIQCLKNKDVQDIIGFQTSIQKIGGMPLGFGPRVDAERKNPFLPRPASELMEKGQFNPVPFIVGMNGNPGSFMLSILLMNNATDLAKLEMDPVNKLRILLGLEFHKNGSFITEEIMKHYLRPNSTGLEVLIDLEKLFSDYNQFKDISQTINQTLKYSNETYVYWYNHRGDVSVSQLLGIPASTDLGVVLGDELLLQFNNDKLPIRTSVQDIKVSKTLIDLWTSFATRGKPTSSSLTGMWLPSSSQQFRYLNLTSNPMMVNNTFPFSNRLTFWKQWM